MAKVSKVNDYVAKNKVMVFSKSYCPYCTKAKKALSKYTSDYTILELDKEDDGSEMQVTGGRSVPRVFIGGKFFGDGDYTASSAGNGTLQKTLEGAGVKIAA